MTNYLNFLWFLFSTDGTLADQSLLLSHSFLLLIVTPTSHSKENSNHNKHDLKDKRIEKLTAELKEFKSLIREELYVMKKMIEGLKVEKAIPKYSVVTESLKEELIYLRNENLTKTQIIKTITKNKYLPSALSRQSSSSTKEPYNTRVEMIYDSTFDLTENKSKRSGLQTRHDSLQAIANNSNNKKLNDNKTTPHKDPSKNSKSMHVPRKNTLIVGDFILKHVEGWHLNKIMKSNVSVRSIPGTSTNGMVHHVKDV